MKYLTQTVTASASNGWTGNCWQTCIAMLLDIDPDAMPAQSECDQYTTTEDGRKGNPVKDSPSYNNRLRAYLREHHNLAYIELHVPEETLPFLRLSDPGFHMMTGRTVRSDAYGGMRHVVVAQHGQMVWDPHPSKAGLLEDIRWALLVPFPRVWRESDALQQQKGWGPSPCVCPMCVAAIDGGDSK